MTTMHRRSLCCSLLIAVACGGKIPLGEGESTGVDTEDGSDDATEDDDSSSDGSDTSSEPTGETGLMCTALEDEPLSDLVVITVNNATSSPLLLMSPPMCDPSTLFQIESDVDGSRSTIDQCFGYCNELGTGDVGCDAGCFAVESMLIQPGATAQLDQWYGRMWLPTPTPTECVAEYGGECFSGTTPATGELRLSLWRRLLDEAACTDGCTCPDDADSCRIPASEEGTEEDLFETMITAGEASIEIVISG